MSIGSTYKRNNKVIAISIASIAITLIMVTLVINSHAMAPVPSLDWAISAGGTDNDIASDMAIDSLATFSSRDPSAALPTLIQDQG